MKAIFSILFVVIGLLGYSVLWFIASQPGGGSTKIDILAWVAIVMIFNPALLGLLEVIKIAFAHVGRRRRE